MMLLRLTLAAILTSLCFGQEAARQEIQLDPGTLGRYVGAYQAPSGAMLLITLQGDQLFGKTGEQGAVPLVPLSETVFLVKANGSELEFTNRDEHGRPTEIIARRDGEELPFDRREDVFADRLVSQEPAAGGEVALRKLIEGIAAGEPDYDSMSPDFADTTRRRFAQLQPELSKRGAIRSITFKSVELNGADIYQIGFEQGALEFRISLGLDGKIQDAAFRPTTIPASAATVRPQLPEVDAVISTDFDRRSIGSITTGVIVGKDLIWSKSYGNANMEEQIPANADTVYRIGSITKMFTALMLEQLVEAGKAHLSDPVEKYFPEIKHVQGRYPDAPPITLLQLATHTSGLDREPADMATYVKGPVEDWEMILLSALPHTRYIAEPGTQFSYSNIGYAILGAALSRVAGQPYTEYIDEHILQPLGMTHSVWEWNDDVLPRLARGYEVRGPNGGVDSVTPAREQETGRGYKVPNGALYSTVGDLARFASFLMGQGPESVLKAASLEHFQQQFVPSNADLTSGYGIGFQVNRHDGYVALGHGGDIAGYHTMLLVNITKGVGVVALSNGSANPGEIASRALDLLSQ